MKRAYASKVISVLKGTRWRFCNSKSGSQKIGEDYNLDIAKSVVACWSTFLRFITSSDVSSFVGQIVSELLAFIEDFPADISSLLELVLIEWNTREPIPVLPPGISFLKRVYDYLAESSVGRSLDDHLASIVYSLESDTPPVRRIGIDKLINLLKASPVYLSQVLWKKDSQVLFSRIVSGLLSSLHVHDSSAFPRGSKHQSSSKTPNAHEISQYIPSTLVLPVNLSFSSADTEYAHHRREDFQSLAALDSIPVLACEALSVIGAIDPCLLNPFALSISSRSDQLDSFELCCKLISEFLYQLIRSSDERTHNSFGYAIQELLRIANIDDQPKDFPEEVWSFVQPFRSSIYQVRHGQSAVGSDVHIFCAGISLLEWSSGVSRCLSSKIRGKNAEIYKCMRAVLRYDLKVNLFLLPYLVYDVLQNSENGTDIWLSNEFLLVISAANIDYACIQAIFSILDTLRLWIDLRQSALIKAGRAFSDSERQEWTVSINRVSSFLLSFPFSELSRCAFACHSYERSLFYLEENVHAERDRSAAASVLTSYRTLLRQLFSKLDDPDALDGLFSASESLDEQALFHEKHGRWSEALSIYEVLLSSDPTHMNYQLKALECMKNLGHFQKILHLVDGLLCNSVSSESRDMVLSFGVQSAWRLQRWDTVQEYLNRYVASDVRKESISASSVQFHSKKYSSYSANPDVEFEARVAEVMLHAVNQRQALDTKEYMRFCISKARESVLSTLMMTSLDGYSRCYPLVVKLHFLSDLETYVEAFLSRQSALDVRNRPNAVEVEDGRYRARLSLTQESMSTREPLIACRRFTSALTVLDSANTSGALWLDLCELARKEGLLDTAQCSLLHASKASPFRSTVAHAELLWDMNEHDRALRIIDSSIKEFASQDVDVPTKAKALLLYGTWSHSSKRLIDDDIIEVFNSMRKLAPRWDHGEFHFAKFLDDVLHSRLAQQSSDDANAVAEKLRIIDRFLSASLRLYATSLELGTDHIFEALPRMLTLWLDFSDILTGIYENNKSFRDSARNVLHSSINSKVIEGKVIRKIPAYTWVVAILQLVSRVEVRDESTSGLLQHILSETLRRFSSHTLWQILPGTHSRRALRSSRMRHIEELAAKSSPVVKQTLKSGQELLSFLLDLSNFQVDGKLRIFRWNSSMNRSYARLLPCKSVVVPTEESLSVQLPHGSADGSWSPFSDHLVTFDRIEDEVEIMTSLQKPKKIFVLCSDGSRKAFLCKPKDDLRKDSRLLEFSSVLNRLFLKEPDTNRRRLRIRTFSVVPLSDDCGLVEWVPGTVGLRSVYDSLLMKYTHAKMPSPAEIKKIHADHHADPVKLMQVLHSRFPSLLRRWFSDKFFEPASWYAARLNYTRSYAVWCMVGGILALGDRHGDNILLDSSNGDVVEVDFDCLFNKGQAFPVPEKVPFRLTHNLVDAFGVTGVAGTFRKVAEITLSLIRKHRQLLLNVLETFVHDPLVEWDHASSERRTTPREHESPHLALKNISNRIGGVSDSDKTSNMLSVEGQVSLLIDSATAPKNLGMMFHMWLPGL
eukprot:ANDGO_08208.mRNA.1 Serine/threonine-protein kinase ATR